MSVDVESRNAGALYWARKTKLRINHQFVSKDTNLLSVISKILTGSLVLVLIWLPLFLFYLSFTCPNLPDQATGHIFYIQELTHNAIYTHAMYATHTEFLLYSASFIAFAVVFSMFIVIALIAKRGTART